MEVNVEEAIISSKIIARESDRYSGKIFREYSKAYLSTTEGIRYYLEREAFKKDRALTVLGGSDYIFNLAFLGVKEIDAFDINRLEYFVYHLRRAMFDNLEYHEFIEAHKFFCDNYYLKEAFKLLDKLNESMPEDVRRYYREVLSYAGKWGRLSNLYYYAHSLKHLNAYLQREEDYLETREKLKSTVVKLYFDDVRGIPERVDGDYDIIILSNIADFLRRGRDILTKEEFFMYIESFRKLLKDEGILINYLYGLDEFFPIITHSNVTMEHIGENVVVIEELDNEGYYRVRKER